MKEESAVFLDLPEEEKEVFSKGFAHPGNTNNSKETGDLPTPENVVILYEALRVVLVFLRVSLLHAEEPSAKRNHGGQGAK